MIVLSVFVSGTCAAGEPCLQILPQTVRNTSLLVTNTQGESIPGRFLRFDRDRSELWIEVFDSRKSRFERSVFPGTDIRGIQKVQNRKSFWYPTVGALVLGGVGAGIPFILDGSEEGSGDSTSSDPTPVYAALLGITGFLVGGITGAIIAPVHTTTETLCGR